MVTAEQLRQHPFFAPLDDIQRNALALITQQQEIEYGGTIFQEGKPAAKLYLLLHGSVDLYFQSEEHPKQRVLAGEISADMPFGISALIAPHAYRMTAKAAAHCKMLVLDGALLRALFALDPHMGYLVMLEIANASQERLHLARLQLARENELEPIL
jgi:CRP-like cAMP-binding protein